MTNKPACKTGGAKIVAYLSRALFLAQLLDRYHPERHYMRGPGPKWLAKHTRQNESRRRSTCRVIDRCDARDGSRLGDNQLVRAAFEPTLMMAPAKTLRVRPRNSPLVIMALAPYSQSRRHARTRGAAYKGFPVIRALVGQCLR